MNSSGYKKYINLSSGISFGYSETWTIREEQFKPDSNSLINPQGFGGAIFVFGPIETICGEGKTVIFLKKIPCKSTGGNIESIDEYVKIYIKVNSFGKTEIIFQKEQKLGDLQGIEVSLTYERPCPFDSPLSRPLKMQHTWLTVLHKNYFFEINYVTSKNDYPLHQDVYENIKKSFKFT